MKTCYAHSSMSSALVEIVVFHTEAASLDCYNDQALPCPENDQQICGGVGAVSVYAGRLIYMQLLFIIIHVIFT